MSFYVNFKGQPTRADFFNACALCRDSVNPHLWVHSFTKALLRRPDMRGFRMPAVWEIMPDMFIEAKAWKEAVQQSIIPAQERVLNETQFTLIIINPQKCNLWTDFTQWERIMIYNNIVLQAIIVLDKNFSGSDLNPNHKLAYFMEDVGGKSRAVRRCI